MYHVSDIKRFSRCKKLYALTQNDHNRKNNFSFFNLNCSVEESVKRKLGITDYFHGTVGDSNDTTFKGLKENEWLIAARFEYDELRVKIPYMHRVDEGFDIYFTSLQLYPGCEDAKTLAYYLTVLKSLGIMINEVYLVHLNGEYVRKKELDDQALWIVSNSFYNSKEKPTKHIQTTIASLDLNVEDVLNEMRQYNLEEDINIERTSKCTRRNKCLYYEQCFPEFDNVSDESVLHLTTSHNKYNLFTNGVEKLQDIPVDQIEGTKLQYAQIMAAKNDGLFVDKMALRSWLKRNVKYPLTFLDFEWDLYAIPPYEKMHPIQNLPFQYSLHIVDNKGQQNHNDYLGFFDCRKELLENLLANIPSKGTIFAYNAKGAEIIRLQELSELFPEYQKEITSIIKRMVDLSIPFESGMIYDLRMRGLYSLKILSKMLHPHNSYQNLEVSHGLEAVEMHRNMEKNYDQKDSEEFKLEVKELLAYCGMDTSELYEVYEWLNQTISN